MAAIPYNGLGIGDLASTGLNWVGGVSPGPFDDALFTAPGLPSCLWDIPAVNKIEISAPGDTVVTLQTDIDVLDISVDGVFGGLLDTNGFDVNWTRTFVETNVGINWGPGSVLTCNGALSATLSAQDPINAPFTCNKTGSLFQFITAPQINGAVAFTQAGAAYTVRFASIGTMLCDAILFSAVGPALLVVESDAVGVQADITVSSPAGANDFTRFIDIAITGGPIIAGANSVDGGNNSGITFGAPAPTCDTSKIRDVLKQLCRGANVAAAAQVDSIEWAVDSGRLRVIAEETPGIPNRGRLPMVQILFAGWLRTPVISGAAGGGESSMLWTIRVHTGGVAREAQQQQSECISQACLDEIRVPAVDPDSFPVEGGDSMGIHEIRAAWHVQDTSIAIDSNYCIPDAP